MNDCHTTLDPIVTYITIGYSAVVTKSLSPVMLFMGGPLPLLSHILKAIVLANP